MSQTVTDTDTGEWDASSGRVLAGRAITYSYDGLYRLAAADYSTGEAFAYGYDAVGNRTVMTQTTPLSGTVVTQYEYNAARRITGRSVSDGRVYSYTWSARGQMLAEYILGYPVRTFAWDGAGRMVEATVFTLTTRLAYDGLGARRTVEVVGHGTTTYTLDTAAGNRILAEETLTGTLLYLYGRDCLGQWAEGEWLLYLSDAEGYVRQGVDEQGRVTSAWLFDPDGVVLEGPQGPVSHLVCGGVYDWSTGLIYRDGRYFDPLLGLWLAVGALVVVQSGHRKRRGVPWYVVLLLVAGMGGMLVGCGGGGGASPLPTPTVCSEIPSPLPGTSPLPTPTPAPTPFPTPVPIPAAVQCIASRTDFDSSPPAGVTGVVAAGDAVELGEIGFGVIVSDIQSCGAQGALGLMQFCQGTRRILIDGLGVFEESTGSEWFTDDLRGSIWYGNEHQSILDQDNFFAATTDNPGISLDATMLWRTGDLGSNPDGREIVRVLIDERFEMHVVYETFPQEFASELGNQQPLYYSVATIAWEWSFEAERTEEGVWHTVGRPEIRVGSAQHQPSPLESWNIQRRVSTLNFVHVGQHW